MGSIGLSVAPTNTFELMVTRGQIPGYRMVDVFGETQAVGIENNEDIWDGVGTRVERESSGILQLLSDSADDTILGNGARLLTIDGLDEQYNEIGEVLTLDGLVRVDTTLEYRRLNHIEVATAGNAGENVGQIICDSGDGTDVLVSVAPGIGHSLLTHYCIPARHTGYLKQLHCYTRGNQAAFVEYTKRPLGGVWTPIRRLEGSQNTLHLPLDYMLEPFREKTDIKMIVLDRGAPMTPVGGSYTLLLIEDGF